MVSMFYKLPIVLIPLLFTGCFWCADPIVPPHIKVIERVPDLAIEMDRGQIDRSDTQAVFNLIKRLRASEKYYAEQLTIYNEEFVK